MNRFLSFLKRNRFFLALVIFQLMVLGFVILFCDIKYETSDDFIVELMLSGTYSGSFNWRLMFSNPYLGRFLVLLYRMNSQVSWYFIFQLTVCFLSLASISWVFTRKDNKMLGVLAAVFITMFAVPDLYVLPQFTKTAAAAIVAGCLLLIEGFIVQQKIIPGIFGGFLALIGTLLRFNTAYSVGLFLLIPVIFSLIRSFIRDDKKIKWLLKVILPCALFVVAAFILRYEGGKLFNRHIEYAQYREYNTVRSRIVDYEVVPYEDIEEELEELEINENDYNILICWSMGDPEKFDIETMNKIVSILDAHRERKVPTFEEFFEFAEERGFLNYHLFWCFAALMIICIGSNWKRLWIPLSCVVIGIFYIGLFYCLGRTVYRVEFCYFFAAAVTVGWGIDRKKAFVNKTVNALICSCLAVAAIVFIGIRVYPVSPVREEDGAYRKVVNDILLNSSDYDPKKYSAAIEYGKVYPNFTKLALENPDKVYMTEFLTTIQTYYFNFSPFESASYCFPSNVLWVAGITTEYPVMRGWLNDRKHNSTIMSLLDKDVYYVGNYNAYNILWYFWDNGYPWVYGDYVEEVDGYHIWKFHG